MGEDNKADFSPLVRICMMVTGTHAVKAGGGPASPTLLFLGGGGVAGWRWGLGGVKELLPGHMSLFPHHPPALLPSPQGECVCAERVSIGGGGARVFNNAAFKCSSSGHILCFFVFVF